MRQLTKTLLAATCLCGCALPALAQEANEPVIVNQVTLGDVFSNISVVVPDGATDASATGTAIGNTGTANFDEGDVEFEADQRQTGEVSAQTTLTGGPVATASTTTTAYGNAVLSGTSEGRLDHTSVQRSENDVSARSNTTLSGVDTLSATTTASGNVSETGSTNGYNVVFHLQENTGETTAETRADICCNNDHVAIASTATANNATVNGSSSATEVGGRQLNFLPGEVNAFTDVKSTSATAVHASSTASGNSVTVHNEWGYATLGYDHTAYEQHNDQEVTGTTIVSLDNWSETSGATAYGVGNSALVSNVGADTEMYVDQTNNGDVSTFASFDGNSADGSKGYVSATSIGNAATATLCTGCADDLRLTGRTNQLNNADISAVGHIGASGGQIHGSATAIGNSATYQTLGTQD